MQYSLPKLEFDYKALEPHIDALTMEIHYSKHHQTYVDNLNKVLAQYPELANKPLPDLLKNLNRLELPEADKTALRNHAGGHLNHSFFWQIMGPKKQIDSQLTREIENKYHSLGDFRDAFAAAALSHFGSGWTWLVRGATGELNIYSTPNQNSPYLTGDTPLIGLDVWEHAYYLKYQNRRADYIQAWWLVLKLL